jgi:hypothetical protein
MSFLSDWWKAFVISESCGMGDPLAHDPKGSENSGGGKNHPSATPRNDQAESLGIEEKIL